MPYPTRRLWTQARKCRDCGFAETRRIERHLSDMPPPERKPCTCCRSRDVEFTQWGSKPRWGRRWDSTGGRSPATDWRAIEPPPMAVPLWREPVQQSLW